jgi:hypothetical protein
MRALAGRTFVALFAAGIAGTTPEEHDRILRAQIEAFSRVVKLAGLRAP